MEAAINPTVKEVAQKAGVSTATVSRVVNRDPRISAETTARVLGVIQEMGYAPNPFARGLKTSRSRTVGFIAPEFTNEFFMGIAKGVESRLRDHRYSLVICNANENTVREGEALGMLLEQGVDGVIVIPSGADGAHLGLAASQKVPVVLVDRLVTGFEADAVLVDNINATYQALEPVLAEGLTDIGFIGGNRDLTPARERYAGYLRALEDFHVAPRSELVRFGDFHAESGYRLMGELMALDRPPRCVFLSNYFMHVGATRFLMDHPPAAGAVPSLVAFDDMELSFTLGFCRTIVRQPIPEIGRRAAELLVDRMEHPEGPAPRVLRLTTEVLRR